MGEVFLRTLLLPVALYIFSKIFREGVIKIRSHFSLGGIDAKHPGRIERH
jgi:hypothetical protein